jgi:uncharacterized membrane protein
MNKSRLEALSDGIFAIVMTLLAVEITVPEIFNPTDAKLLTALHELTPLFISYFASFTVLAMFWISHKVFYSSFTKDVNRILVLLNILFLSLVALLPFSARLLGLYIDSSVAVLTYGINVFAIGLVASVVLQYAIVSNEIDTAHISRRLLTQARIRSLLTPAFTLLGMAFVGVSVSLVLVLYAFPILFNIIPGMLNLVERKLGLDFDQ